MRSINDHSLGGDATTDAITRRPLSRRGFLAAAATTAVAASLVGVGAGVAQAAEASSAKSDAKAGAASSAKDGASSSTTEADLVVIGAGAAGLAAAARAAQLGASVIVLEAAGATGGTTKTCGGHWKFINDDFLAKLPARTDESDATISEVLDWDPATFGDYAQACEKCQADVEAYLASDDPLEFDSIEYWLSACTSSARRARASRASRRARTTMSSRRPTMGPPRSPTGSRRAASPGPTRSPATAATADPCPSSRPARASASSPRLRRWRPTRALRSC